jgi:K+-sensing histidine kinase KdpD
LIACGWLAHQLIFSNPAHAVFTTFLIPITLTAAIAGLAPALLSVCLATLVGWYFFLSPAFSFALDAEQARSLVIFFTGATFMVVTTTILKAGRL